MIYLYLLVMAGVTYLTRMLPLTLFQKPIQSRFWRSFLYYVPYACLAAMTVPAIFSATQGVWSAAAGFAVALVLGWMGKSLILVAACSCGTVFCVEQLLTFLPR